MWVLFAFVSATIVGIRDSFKKSSLQGNDVLTVLFLNTLFSALLFLPFILLSRYSELFTGSFFYVPTGGLTQHFYSVGKCLLLLGCWLCSYNGIKHLPLTISGIIIAFGPVETVIGAMLLYGESLNVLQWVGVAVSVGSLVAVSMSGKKEGIDFRHNRYVWVMFLSTLFSAAAALYDKLVMGRPEDGGMGNSVMFIQSWYNIYQTALLLLILLYRQRSLRKQGQGAVPFRFVWSIVMVSLCEVSADLLYDAALQLPGCMVSILAMVRRGSVVVSFFIGVLFFHEKNLRSKIWDLLLVLLGMLLLYFGSIE